MKFKFLVFFLFFFDNHRFMLGKISLFSSLAVVKSIMTLIIVMRETKTMI